MRDEDEEKIVGMIGIARRAGVLTAGFDSVVAGMKAGKVAAAFIAIDCSPKTKKEVRFFGGKYECKVVEIPLDMDTLKLVFGKRVGVMAISQEALADRIEILSEKADEEECK